MCKVAGIAGIKDDKRTETWVFMMLLGDVISQGNSDGLGYAALDQENKLFGERWLINHTAFHDLTKIPKIHDNLDRFYHAFGDISKREEAKAMILHTRMATCAHGIQNAHPHVDNFKEPTVALIHNGVITNHLKFKKINSTCDSEVIVHQYKENNVATNLNNLSKFTKSLQGWFTCLTLSKTPENIPVMDAFTDSPRLNSYYIPELEARVYSTRGEDIKRVAQMLELKYESPQALAGETAIRLNADTGEMIEKVSIPLKSWTSGFNVMHANGSFDDEMDIWDHWFHHKGYKE